MNLSIASIPVTAIHADPLTAAEIDAHPDRDRIWATIARVAKEVSEDQGYDDFWGSEED